MGYLESWVSPSINRFLSADSIVPNPFNPQDYNRFSYVRNNPRYIDPSGHICVQNGGGLDEFAIPGTCNGDPNPNFSGNILPSPTAWTRGNKQDKPTFGESGGGGGNNGGESGGSDGGITIPFDTDEIVSSIPGTSQQWSTISSTADEIALAWDILLGVYVLTWVGIGLGGGLMFEGNPVTGLAGVSAGYVIGEGSIFLSGALFPGNLVATAATFAGAVADAKSGATSIDGQLNISPNSVSLTANGQLASTTATAITLTGIGWAANLVVLSLPLQLAAVENDRGTFGSESIPVNIDFSFP